MKTYIALLALAVAAAPVLSFGAVSISVDKAELITDLVPGQKRVLKFQVTNSGSESAPITVYSEDWQIRNGEPDFNNKTHDRALGSRVTVSPSNVDLAAGASAEVTVVLDPGPGPFVAGSYWSGIFVQNSHLTEAQAVSANRGAQMRIVERIAVLLFADSAPESKPLPADVAITGIKSTTSGLGITVNNPSAYMRLISSASLSITPLAGGDTKKIPMRSFHLLPNCSQELSVNLPKDIAGLGRTSVLAVIDYGAQELVVGEARIKF